MAKRSIIWDKKAWHDFIKILEYIRNESPENAIRVGNRIAGIIHTIPEFPEMYKQDDLKTKNNGSIRVFVQDRIRITYRIEPSEIYIVQVRHTSQEPFEY